MSSERTTIQSNISWPSNTLNYSLTNSRCQMYPPHHPNINVPLTLEALHKHHAVIPPNRIATKLVFKKAFSCVKVESLALLFVQVTKTNAMSHIWRFHHFVSLLGTELILLNQVIWIKQRTSSWLFQFTSWNLECPFSRLAHVWLSCEFGHVSTAGIGKQISRRTVT